MRKYLSKCAMPVMTGWRASSHAGFTPEAELIDLVGNGDAYDYLRRGVLPHTQVMDAADRASASGPSDIYWGTTGLLIQGEASRAVLPALKKAAKDPSTSVSLAAAEALYKLGEKESGRQALLRTLKSPNMIARAYALNVIVMVDEESEQIRSGVLGMFTDNKKLELARNYDQRCVQQLFKEWVLSLTAYGLEEIKN